MHITFVRNPELHCIHTDCIYIDCICIYTGFTHTDCTHRDCIYTNCIHTNCIRTDCIHTNCIHSNCAAAQVTVMAAPAAAQVSALMTAHRSPAATPMTVMAVCYWSHHRPTFALNDSNCVCSYHLQANKQLCRAVVNIFTLQTYVHTAAKNRKL